MTIENIDIALELSQIKVEKQKAHDDTMWGKPANDIITGIGNNDGIKPARAIWEMVQNARDVFSNEGAHIVFTRRENDFLFQHDGIPFTNHTIEALYLQTSSKARNDIVQIGQYGTGFLTTHKFGLCFELSGSLKVSSTKEYYHNFENLLFDRSPKDKEEMIDNLKKLYCTIAEWGESWDEISKTPVAKTTFRYLHKNPIEKKNVQEAFFSSPLLAPYVIALNDRVKSIKFHDEVDNQIICYERGEETVVGTFDDIKLSYIEIKYISATITTNSTQIHKVYLLKSLVDRTETGESNITVILPIDVNKEGKERVSLFNLQIPNLYLYLPLLGTEQWGFNFLLHSPCFTCDKDSRDSLRFIGNGQNNDDQAEINRALVDKANEMITAYINRYLDQLNDVKYLAKANFQAIHASSDLGVYYKILQDYWIERFEKWNLIKINEGMTAPINVHVLNKELCTAAAKDNGLLNALFYFLTLMYSEQKIPTKEDLIYWSDTIYDWYPDEKHEHFVAVEMLVDFIEEMHVSDDNIEYLLKINEYLSENHEKLFEKKKLIPNLDKQLNLKTSLVFPDKFNTKLMNVMRTLIPEEVSKFVHPLFLNLFQFAKFDDIKVKECLSGRISKLKEVQDAKRLELRKNRIGKIEFNPQEFKKYCMEKADVNAVLSLLHAVVSEESTAFEARILSLLDSFYNYSEENTDKLDKKIYDCRTFYRPLVADALYLLSLTEEDEDAFGQRLDLIRTIQEYDEMENVLQYYRIYPNQIGIYCYSGELKKEEENLPKRLKDIYDIIVRGVTKEDSSQSIKHELVSEDFACCFVGAIVLKAETLAKEIVDKVYKETQYNISSYPHQQLVLEIIENLDEPRWKSWFMTLDNVKPNIMMSVIQDKDKKRDLFRIMKLNDKEKLKKIIELAEDKDFERIVELGKKALLQEQNKHSDFNYKKALGLYVENYLVKELKEQLSDKELRVIPEDVQDGQDIIVYLDKQPFYYIEIKSRWVTADSVMMSASQLNCSILEKERYALMSVDMTDYNRINVERHEYPEAHESLHRISVLDNIGHLNAHLSDAISGAEDVVHIGGDYKAVVPQKLIKVQRKQFNEFIINLKNEISKKL